MLTWSTRPVASQIGAWVSEQSTVVPNRKVLEEQMAALEKWYEATEIPTPPYWGGYRVSPRQSNSGRAAQTDSTTVSATRESPKTSGKSTASPPNRRTTDQSDSRSSA